MSPAKAPSRVLYVGLLVLVLFVGFILGTFSSSFLIINSPDCTASRSITDKMAAGGVEQNDTTSNVPSIASNSNSKSNSPTATPTTATTVKNKCTCPDRLYTNSSWKRGEWLVDDPDHCHLEPWTASAFCQVLGNRSILMAGDSISGQYYAQLLRQNKTVTDTIHLHQRLGDRAFPVHRSGTICQGGAHVTFIRNDYLRLDQTLEASVTAKAFLIPWLHLIPSHDILLLNTGVHVPPGKIDFYTENLKQLRVYLEETIQYPGQVIFRTTPRGHSNCSATDKPITSTNSPDWKRFFESNVTSSQFRRYEWNLMPSFNQIMMQEMESMATVLDVAPMTELRPDQHAKPATDCLHYDSQSNVYSVWNQLLYNALLGNVC